MNIIRLLAMAALAILSLCGYAQPKRPNIIVIFSDDHTRQAISAYGSTLAQTPGIDRIAKEGALFTNTFVTNSICAPSRAVLLTGKYGHMSGLVDNSPRRRFDGGQQQLQKLLGAGGYRTAWIGKWHLNTLPQGFDHWQVLPDQGHYYNPDFINMQNDTITHAGYVSDVITDFSLEWLNSQPKEQPFFLVVGHKATHREWLPDLQDLGAYDDRDFPLPSNFFDNYAGRAAAADNDMTISQTMRLGLDLKVHIDYKGKWIYGRFTPPQLAAFKGYYDKISSEHDAIQHDSLALVKWKYQRYLKDYLATARSMDRNIERLLQYLDTHGLANNTIVVYASDQGFYLGEHGWFDKRFMYEESLSTPFLMRWPGVIKPGTVVKDMVVNIDFAPTLLEAAGVAVPADIQGKSVLSLLKGAQNTPAAWRKAMYYRYYEYPEPHRVSPHIGIRTERYKLIRFEKPAPYWELIDLQADPAEMKNLYGQKGYEKLTQQLRAQLVALAKAYGDEEGAGIIAGSK